MLLSWSANQQIAVTRHPKTCWLLQELKRYTFILFCGALPTTPPATTCSSSLFFKLRKFNFGDHLKSVYSNTCNVLGNVSWNRNTLIRWHIRSVRNCNRRFMGRTFINAFNARNVRMFRMRSWIWKNCAIIDAHLYRQNLFIAWWSCWVVRFWGVDCCSSTIFHVSVRL